MTDHPPRADVDALEARLRALACTSDLTAPSIGPALDDLADVAPDRAGGVLADLLVDDATSGRLLEQLLASPHTRLLDPQVAGHAYVRWAGDRPHRRHVRRDLLLSLRRHAGPDAWLPVPTDHLALVPTQDLEALVALHLPARSWATFSSLWEDWDGTLGALIDTARKLHRQQ